MAEPSRETRTHALSSDPAEIAPALEALLGPTGQPDPSGTLDAAAADDLRLCVAEALNNCILHGYGGARGRPIRLRIEAGGDRIAVCIQDRGRAPPAELFDDPCGATDDRHGDAARDPADAAADPAAGGIGGDRVAIADLPESGWGLMLMRTLLDRLRIETADGWNTLVMEKRRDR